MGKVLHRGLARMARPVALLWMWVLAPLELATTLTGLLSTPSDAFGLGGVGLVAARSLVVAFGLIVGRQLLQRAADAGPLAVRWALLDLVTLAVVLATDALPTNRLPGTAPLVWATYALLDGLVIVAATGTPDA